MNPQYSKLISCPLFLLQKVKSKIFEAYQENKQDPRFSEAREKFKYLHSKLAYIKGLVSSYDSHVNNVE